MLKEALLSAVNLQDRNKASVLCFKFAVHHFCCTTEENNDTVRYTRSTGREINLKSPRNKTERQPLNRQISSLLYHSVFLHSQHHAKAQTHTINVSEQQRYLLLAVAKFLHINTKNVHTNISRHMFLWHYDIWSYKKINMWVKPTSDYSITLIINW